MISLGLIVGGGGRHAISGVEVDVAMSVGSIFKSSHLALCSTVTVESRRRANSGLISAIVLAHGMGFWREKPECLLGSMK